MLHKLKYLLVAMIILSLVFTGCLIFYVSANDKLIDYEKSKNSLLNFNSIYNKASNELITETKSYISTGDVTAKYKITDYANSLMDCNRVNADHIRFSSSDELSGFEVLNDFDKTSSEVHSTFSFNSKEQALFLSYLESNTLLLDIILSAANQKDVSLLYTPEFIDLISQKETICADYTYSYLNRMHAKTDKLEAFIQAITIISVLLGAVLALCGGRSVSLYLKKNQYNAYFNQLYSKAIENSDIGMAIVDKHYKYEYMNSTYKHLLNIQSSNPIGQTSFAVLPEALAATLPSHTFSENQRDIVLSYTHEGEVKYINYNCFAIFDEKDEPKFITLIQDCTDSNRKDTALKQQLKDIEFFANAKASFIANVSHEIKTPLNVIIGMVHILKGTGLTERQQDVLSKIHISSELLLNIINDVLDISKIQKSSFVLYPSDFNLLSMLEESEEIFAPIIYNKGLKYVKEFNFSPDLCLSLDKTRLAQVLLNLVNNASKFTATGHIRLAIEQLAERGQSVLLKFTIEDTGMGIDEEDASKVFQEFEQLENHLTKQHQGTGLGLAICKHVVNAMGGDIWVESQKSVGSKFQFTVWARTVATAKCSIKPASSNGFPLLNGEGRRVLVVEDTELNYEVTENMLSDSNIVCDHAWDGQEAIDMCIKVPEDYYTAILMDIHMPNMDGYTSAEILKTEIGIICPIIALTATNIDPDTVETHKTIMDDFVSKPFRYQDFYRALLPYFGTVEKDVSEVVKPSIKAKKLLQPETPIYNLSSILTLSEAAQNLGCSEKQYIKHLTKFKTSYAHVDADIQELLIDKNYTEAHRIAHSVKGLAGTLGLFPLQQVAAELEAALNQESEKAATILTVFKDELDGVCKPGVECN